MNNLWYTDKRLAIQPEPAMEVLLQVEVMAPKRLVVAGINTERTAAQTKARRLAKVGLQSELERHQFDSGFDPEERLNWSPLSPREYAAWRLFLGDTFSTDVAASQCGAMPTNVWGFAPAPHVFEVRRYNRDKLPSPVLDIWERAQDSRLFDRFEIWCRQMQTDPMLVGVRQGVYYPLARWGEDDENFLSFDQVLGTLREHFEGQYESDYKLESFLKPAWWAVGFVGFTILGSLSALGGPLLQALPFVFVVLLVVLWMFVGRPFYKKRMLLHVQKKLQGNTSARLLWPS